jgi:hypothetical protein
MDKSSVPVITTTCDHGTTWDANDPHDPNACPECIGEYNRQMEDEAAAQHEQEARWEAEQDRITAEHERRVLSEARQ